MSDNLPAVPWADLMDDAEATYWDAENVHGTDAGIRALTEWAYRKGIAAAFEVGKVSHDWATRWTHDDGDATVMSANSAGAGAEQLARKRAKQVMRGVGPGEAIRRVQFTGPWVVVPEEVAR